MNDFGICCEGLEVDKLALERLEDECRSVEKMLAGNEEYIKQANICTDIFKRLSACLSKEQRALLFDYEEATALKEVLVTGIIIHRAS